MSDNQNMIETCGLVALFKDYLYTTFLQACKKFENHQELWGAFQGEKMIQVRLIKYLLLFSKRRNLQILLFQDNAEQLYSLVKQELSIFGLA